MEDLPNFSTAYFELDRDIAALSTSISIETAFAGQLDGNGHTISAWGTEALPKTGGLFASLGTGGVIENLVLEGHVDFGATVGAGLLVHQNAGALESVIARGSVKNANHIGLMVGANNGTGVIRNCLAEGSVSGGGGHTGGLTGRNDGRIEHSASKVDVSGGARVGGLTGSMTGTIVESQASGSVVAANLDAGCLVGTLFSGSISDSKGACTSVSAPVEAGGLVGTATGEASITNTLSVTAVVTGTSAGGLVAVASKSVTTSASYYDESVEAASASGLPLDGTELIQQSSYVGWDFATIWSLPPGASPVLRSVNSGS